jgi:hypothetical protein
MENESKKLHNNNNESKTVYIVLNYTSDLLNNKVDLSNLPKNISTDFNINLLESKTMSIFLIVMDGKKNSNELRIFNTKEFCNIEKSLYFKDINVHNYSFDNIRDILFINQQKEFIMNINDIELKLKKYINRFIYNCIYFNSKANELLLLKMNNLESLNLLNNNDKKELISLIKSKIYKKEDDTKDETSSDVKNFVLDKSLLKQFPPKVSSLYDKKYKFGKDKIPNVFYNHLLITDNVNKNKKSCFKCSLTRRIKGKSLTILFYSPVRQFI